jgi:hypothetical protein
MGGLVLNKMEKTLLALIQMIGILIQSMVFAVIATLTPDPVPLAKMATNLVSI